MKFSSSKFFFKVFFLATTAFSTPLISSEDDIDCSTCCQEGTLIDPECCKKCGNCPLSPGQVGCHNYPAY